MKEIQFTLAGSIRSKKNSKRIIVAGSRRIILPSKAYVAWERQVQLAIARACSHAYQRPLLPDGDVHVEAHIYYKGGKPDLSGALESIGDALEGYIWANDSQIVSWDGSRLYHDLKNPRTEVTVRWE
ncbi:MAG TPA: RusA family crossover junction endodeoxyribonuclease [Dissulfurispiraceae bacterium]|nr:RusA family crossover junction endodeoxyribonuclease [Dissulfurispiraceae bacterium]